MFAGLFSACQGETRTPAPKKPIPLETQGTHAPDAANVAKGTPDTHVAQSTRAVRPPAPMPNPLGLEFQPISGLGATSPRLQLPGGPEGRDVIDAGRTTNGKRLACLLRPGDMLVTTQDEGMTWSIVPLDQPIIEVEPGNQLWWGLGGLDRNNIARKLVRSRDRGKEFKDHFTLEALILEEPRLLRSFDRWLYFAVEKHLVYSLDRGETWHYSDPQLERYITALHIDPEGQRWTGADRGVISRSTGERRTPYQRVDLPPTVGPIIDFASHPDKPTLAVTRKGLWRFQEEGETHWQHVEGVGQRPLHGARYLTGALIVAFGPAARLLISKDSGSTWHDATPLIVEQLGLSKQEALGLHWRHAEAVTGGVMLMGDHATLLKIKIP